MPHSRKDAEPKPLKAVARVLDSRWMMALSVAAVLVAIVWALLDNGLPTTQRDAAPGADRAATIELLGVPSDAEVLLDGRRIENTRFGISPGTRHLIEVSDAEGRSWRQVLLADGSLSLVVELRTCFVEVDVSPTDQETRD
jgi:hypothetical protein